jgi:hypothetical protein
LLRPEGTRPIRATFEPAFEDHQMAALRRTATAFLQPRAASRAPSAGRTRPLPTIVDEDGEPYFLFEDHGLNLAVRIRRTGRILR